MEIVTTFSDARARRSGIVGLVPTMGFLHEGHLALIEAATREADLVLVSLFVNPLQFDEDADLARYPRDLDRDAALAADAGADVLFAPSVDEMYPSPPVTRVRLASLTTTMEGAHRPGHFDGVATVVAKLFAGLQPDKAWFGMKDAQQLVVVSRMAQDLSLPVEVIGHPIVREADGLALSSRNVFLGPDERHAALSLSRGLFAAADAVRNGERAGRVLEGLVVEEVARSGAGLDYAELAGADDLVRLDRLDQRGFLAVAARVGETRLIDNVWLDEDGSAQVGQRLDQPSILYG